MMAFEKEKLAKFDAGFSGSPGMFRYFSLVDDITAIGTPGYFNDISLDVTEGDLIYIVPSTSGTGLFEMAVPGGTVIITELYPTSIPTQNIGNMTSAASTTTTINTMNTYELISNPTLLNVLSNNFDMPQNNRLRYTGTDAVTFQVVVNLAVNRSMGGSDTYAIAVFKNGILEGETEINSFATQNAILPIGTNGIEALTTNDFIEMKVKNTTGTSDIDVEKMNVSIIGLS